MKKEDLTPEVLEKISTATYSVNEIIDLIMDKAIEIIGISMEEILEAKKNNSDLIAYKRNVEVALTYLAMISSSVTCVLLDNPFTKSEGNIILFNEALSEKSNGKYKLVKVDD